MDFQAPQEHWLQILHAHTWSHRTENASAMRETSLCLMLIHSDAQRISVQGYTALRSFNQISTLSCSGEVHTYLLTSDAATALHQTNKLKLQVSVALLLCGGVPLTICTEL